MGSTSSNDTVLVLVLWELNEENLWDFVELNDDSIQGNTNS